MKKKEFGLKGESLTVNFLTRKKYKILAKNWHYKHKEIDIIAKTDDCLIVVEVKTRSSEGIETPNELVTRKKQRFIIEAAEAYIQQNNIECETRFDVVLIYYKNGNPEIEHIEDAFHPSLL